MSFSRLGLRSVLCLSCVYLVLSSLWSPSLGNLVVACIHPSIHPPTTDREKSKRRSKGTTGREDTEQLPPRRDPPNACRKRNMRFDVHETNACAPRQGRLGKGKQIDKAAPMLHESAHKKPNLSSTYIQRLAPLPASQPFLPHSFSLSRDFIRLSTALRYSVVVT